MHEEISGAEETPQKGNIPGKVEVNSPELIIG